MTIPLIQIWKDNEKDWKKSTRRTDYQATSWGSSGGAWTCTSLLTSSRFSLILFSTSPYWVASCLKIVRVCLKLSKHTWHTFYHMTWCLYLSSQDSTRPRMMQAEVINAWSTVSKVPYLARWKCWFITDCKNCNEQMWSFSLNLMFLGTIRHFKMRFAMALQAWSCFQYQPRGQYTSTCDSFLQHLGPIKKNEIHRNSSS